MGFVLNFILDIFNGHFPQERCVTKNSERNCCENCRRKLTSGIAGAYSEHDVAGRHPLENGKLEFPAIVDTSYNLLQSAYLFVCLPPFEWLRNNNFRRASITSRRWFATLFEKLMKDSPQFDWNIKKNTLCGTSCMERKCV